MGRELTTTGTVYHAFDTETGKAYVGQTWAPFPVRRDEHLQLAGKKRHPFYNALNKRPSSFVWSIIVTVKSQDELDAAEDSFIVELNTLFPAGYNLRRGGIHGKMTQEVKNKISASKRGVSPSLAAREASARAQRGKKMPLEVRAKIAASVAKARRLNDPLKGRVMSQEQRDKISKSLKGRKKA